MQGKILFLNERHFYLEHSQDMCLSCQKCGKAETGQGMEITRFTAIKLTSFIRNRQLADILQEHCLRPMSYTYTEA